MKTHTKTATVLAMAMALATAGFSAAVAAASNPPSLHPARRARAAAREPARAFLTIDARRSGAAPRTLYVGETVPVTIRAYFLGGTSATLSGAPRLSSDGLTLSGLPDKPAKSMTETHGLPYTVLTWTGQLTAARAGAAPTAVELPIEIAYRERVRMPGVFGADQADSGQDNGDQGTDNSDDPFASLLRGSPLASDPFFSQMLEGGDPFAGMLRDLGGAVRQREVTLRGSAGDLRVLDLPSPAPAGFTGAVGAFDAAASVASGPYHVGEPTKLTVRVGGRGSFSRLSVAGITANTALATYGVTAAFAPGSSPLDGTKTFVETIVPRQPGDLTVPAVSFAYFDPRERRYVTRRTQPIGIVVAAAPGEAASPPATASGAPGAASAAEVSGAPGASAARGANDIPDVVRSSLEPVTRTRGFVVFLAALGLATALLATLGPALRRGALGRPIAARRLRARISAEEREARAAAARGDAAALFAAGRKALQARLAAGWHVPPGAIAAADVERRLGERGGRIREIFERADRVQYTGDRASVAEDDDLEQWPERISAALRALESTT
jgi:oxygen tolerance protein BatD